MAGPTDAALVDPLTRFLLPVVLHKLANVTQLLTGFHALLALEGGDELLLARASELGQSGAQVEDLGWLIAVLGSASGNDLLLARREPRGLQIMIDSVSEGARRAGAPLHASQGGLPRLAPDCLDGWQLPWAVGSLLAAATQDGGGGSLAWGLEQEAGGCWVLSLPVGGCVLNVWKRVAAALPGAEFTAGDDARLVLPAEWLAPAPGPDCLQPSG